MPLSEQSGAYIEQTCMHHRQIAPQRGHVLHGSRLDVDFEEVAPGCECIGRARTAHCRASHSGNMTRQGAPQHTSHSLHRAT